MQTESTPFTVEPNAPVVIGSQDFPWINQSPIAVPTKAITLQDGTSFAYGSIVGVGGSLVKLAEQVPGTASDSLQATLFNAIPSIIRGLPYPAISRVGNAQHIGTTLFIASKNLARLPGLVFSVDSINSSSDIPVVLRAGLSTSSDHAKLLSLLGVSSLRNSRRTSS